MKKEMSDLGPGAVDFERVALDLVAGTPVPRPTAAAFWNEAPRDLRERVVADMLALDARHLGEPPSAR